MSPISAGQDPAEVLAVEQPLDLALAVLGQVEPVAVEEAHDDRLRVGLDQPDGEAGHRVRLAGHEAGDRHRGDLEVEHVDAGGVEPRHHRPLQHAGRSRRVAGRDDRRLLLQRGRVGHRQPGGQLGRDVDVGETGDAVAAEQRRGRPATPTRSRSSRPPPVSTVLNGYTFTPAPSTALSPTKHSSPSTTPSSQRTPLRRSQARPTTVPRRRTLGPR